MLCYVCAALRHGRSAAPTGSWQRTLRSRTFFRIEPLGMEYIAAALEAHGHRVALADLRFSRSARPSSCDTRPALVGIAAMHALEPTTCWRWRRRSAGCARRADRHRRPYGRCVSGAVSRRRSLAVVLDDGERALPGRCDAIERGAPADDRCRAWRCRTLMAASAHHRRHRRRSSSTTCRCRRGTTSTAGAGNTRVSHIGRPG